MAEAGVERGEEQADDTEQRDRVGWVRDAARRLHAEVAALADGAVATYIPELAEVDPDSVSIDPEGCP